MRSLHKHPLSWYLAKNRTHMVLLLAALFIGIPFFWMVHHQPQEPREVRVFPPDLVAEDHPRGTISKLA
jgi:hypothetical protein